MPWYTRDLELKCSQLMCGRKSSVEVFDRWNQSRGKYCRIHGKRIVAECNEADRLFFAAEKQQGSTVSDNDPQVPMIRRKS